jgi:hypothetical protein
MPMVASSSRSEQQADDPDDLALWDTVSRFTALAD